MVVKVLVAGRVAFRISARGRAREWTELYLKSWTSLPIRSVRRPVMKIGGRFLQFEHLPSEFGVWQIGQRFW